MKWLTLLARAAVATALLGAMVVAFSEPRTLMDLRARSRLGGETATVVRQPGGEQLNRLLVKFKDNTAARVAGSAAGTGADVQRIASRMAATASAVSQGRVQSLAYVRAASGDNHVYLTDQPLDRAGMQAVIDTLRQDPAIDSVSIDERMVPHSITINDPGYTDAADKQWYLKPSTTNLGAANFAGAWNRSTLGSAPVSGAGKVVAVLDSGYLVHPDLSSLVTPSYDFISLGSNGLPTIANDGNGRDNDALDPGDANANANLCETGPSSWHGTRVAGIVGAATNSIGIIGAAYGAQVLPVRVLGVCGGYISDVVDAMRWAAGIYVTGVSNTNPNSHPAQVINLSLGGSGTCSDAYKSAIADVRSIKNVTVIVSTGNDASTSTITQPANCPNVIAVSAHRSDGQIPVFANVGAGTTLSAPGVDIYSTSNDGTPSAGNSIYESASGTSFSAPLVASVAAMLYQIKPTITPDEVASHLVNSVRSFPVSTFCSGNYACGAGLLDADAAVARALADSSAISNASASKTNDVARGSTITLTGVAALGANASGSGAGFTTAWTQVAGPTVAISNASSTVATFVTPAKSNDTLLAFRFRVTSNANNANYADSYATVNMVSAPVAATSSGGGGGGGSMDITSLGLLAALLVLLSRTSVRHTTANQKREHPSA